jgi:AI-2 transport protein TqsA
MGNDNHPGVQALKIAAYVVIAAYGIRLASHLLSILLIALLLTYAIVPFPQWLVRRFHLHRSIALSCTVLLVMAFYCGTTFALLKAGLQMSTKLPVYELRIQDLYQQITGFLARHGFELSGQFVKSSFSSERIMKFIGDILPATLEFFSDRLLIWFLTLLFLVALMDPERAKGPIAQRLVSFGKDIQLYIASTAKTGAVTATVNLLLLTLLGVDFAVVWCFLYFFLHFIPSIGFLIALVPPTLLALLMIGWKRALFVLACLVLTEMLGENVLKPILLKKDLDVSLMNVTLSLLGWGYLIGPAGAVLSVPLTLGLLRIIENGRSSASPQRSLVAS